MTTADAVRQRLGLGRLVPLGQAADGAWLSERAAEAVLRPAAAGVAGVVPGRLRLALAHPEAAAARVIPPPPGALPPGPLRLEADFEAVNCPSLPGLAAQLRTVLFAVAVDVLDLVVTDVDLRVTGLLDTAPESTAPTPPLGVRPAEPNGPAALAAYTTPGVACLTATLGAPVHSAADHVRVELATEADHRPLTVVRAVRDAVSTTLADGRPVSVLITALSG